MRARACWDRAFRLCYSRRKHDAKRKRHTDTPYAPRGVFYTFFPFLFVHLGVALQKTTRKNTHTSTKQTNVFRSNPRCPVPRSHPRVPYLQVHAVPEGVAMMVTELKCKQDNCPPFETIMVVMYGAAGGRAYFFHLHHSF